MPLTFHSIGGARNLKEHQQEAGTESGRAEGHLGDRAATVSVTLACETLPSDRHP